MTLPEIPDRFGVLFPDGPMHDCTDAARLFGQDPEERARMVAAKHNGIAVRIRTALVELGA